ncbi:MAG: hypothetical protein LBG17_03210 [Bacteroidales bacterium]|jgi:hypothetical protein|nr:hypothetical protein [Bacteroidales bacterium]
MEAYKITYGRKNPSSHLYNMTIYYRDEETGDVESELYCDMKWRDVNHYIASVRRDVGGELTIVNLDK